MCFSDIISLHKTNCCRCGGKKNTNRTWYNPTDRIKRKLLYNIRFFKNGKSGYKPSTKKPKHNNKTPGKSVLTFACDCCVRRRTRACRVIFEIIKKTNSRSFGAGDGMGGGRYIFYIRVLFFQQRLGTTDCFVQLVYFFFLEIFCRFSSLPHNKRIIHSQAKLS